MPDYTILLKTVQRQMMVACALANGGDSYFPTAAAIDEGGYEARSSYLKKGVDDIFVNGALELFN